VLVEAEIGNYDVYIHKEEYIQKETVGAKEYLVLFL